MEIYGELFNIKGSFRFDLSCPSFRPIDVLKHGSEGADAIIQERLTELGQGIARPLTQEEQQKDLHDSKSNLHVNDFVLLNFMGKTQAITKATTSVKVLAKSNFCYSVYVEV